MRNLVFIVISLVSLSASVLWGGTGRDEFQKTYTTQLENSPSIFGGAPVYHIIPKENTITFAGAYQYADVLVAGPGVNARQDPDTLDARLEMNGWSASPYVAFSAKRFGFGFAGEAGQRQIHYLSTIDAGRYEEHLGQVAYSGVGFNAFWIPGWSFLPKFAMPTFIAGMKALNVVHKSSGDLVEPFSTIEMSKRRYVVQNYEAGCNLRLNLVKRFTIIPWVDYSTFIFGASKLADGSASTQTDASISDDADLIWRASPALTYGIDFGVDVLGIHLRLGGLIGALGNLQKGSDRIKDGSNAVSLSLEIKGGS